MPHNFSFITQPFTRPRKTRNSLGFPESSAHSANASLYHSRSLQQLCDEKKAKKVRFYRNGDRFHPGLIYAISSTKVRSFDMLLSDLTSRLTDNVNLPQGVRFIFSVDGLKKINSIHEFEQGESYVCSSSDFYKKINYAQNTNPNWCANVRTCSSSSLKLRQQEKSDWICQDPKTFSSHESLRRHKRKQICDFIHPKLITVIRSGRKPRKAVRMLLNKKTAHSLEQIFNDISKLVRLDTGAVRKIYSVCGKQIFCLKDFFGDEDVFIAYGQEKLSQDDFIIDDEEAKFIQFYQSSGLRSSKSISHSRLHQFNQTADADMGQSRLFSKRSFSKKSSSKWKSFNESYNSTGSSKYGFPTEITERFVIGSIIGDGNFAVVHECVDRSNDERFALKVIDKFKSIGQERLIYNEVSILKRIEHPNIVKLFHNYNFKHKIYLVMELINGGDLFSAISSTSSFTEHDASGMVCNLASALAYIHEMKIVHRDIKPENLLVFRCKNAKVALKVADFGLATVVTEPLYTVCGTPTYLAPEIILQTGYNLKIDIWAAGIITYILLYGFPPFYSETNSQEELFDRILGGNIEFPSTDVSESARGLILKTLNCDPDHRFSANEILKHPWVSGQAKVFVEAKRDNSERHLPSKTKSIL
ncbi:unnamed protein product [Clavelina lepadiformis]|uniref:non-specific serine/threonine protein kinase n=1 Tax=Clavelina lepadiformis TaxID=159417 RepID=A0ABP0F676_CLALP